MPFTVRYDTDQHCVSYVPAGIGRMNTATQAAVLAQMNTYIAGAPTAMQTIEDQTITVGRERGRYPVLRADGPAQVTAIANIVNAASAI